MEETMDFRLPDANSTINPERNMTSQDSGYGPHTRKRGRDFSDFKVPTERKKPKIIHRSNNDLVDKVRILANKERCSNLVTNGNQIGFEIKPNKQVFAKVSIWKEKELNIVILFPNVKERVTISNESYGKLAIKVKIEWLQNFVANIKRISSKEQLIPGCLNWAKHIKCKRPKMESIDRSENGLGASHHHSLDSGMFHSYSIASVSMEVPPSFPSFSVKQQKKIEEFYRAAGSREFRRVIRGTDIRCLLIPAANSESVDLWFNDQVIDQNLEMLCLRPNKMKVRALSVHFFQTYHSHGYERSREIFIGEIVEFFKFDMVLVPIIHNNHCCLAIIRPKRRQIELYDSLYSDSYGDYIFTHLFSFLSKFLEIPDISDYWTKHSFRDTIPQQQNGYDCGVYTCIYAEYALLDKMNFDFTQAHMPYFRHKILYEICTGELILKK